MSVDDTSDQQTSDQQTSDQQTSDQQTSEQQTAAQHASISYRISYLELPELFYRFETPDEFPDLKIALWNDALAKELGFVDAQQILTHFRPASRQSPSPHSHTLTLGYAGHQFGHFVPQLGDGRAHLLDEIVIDQEGTRQQLDIHAKGSGATFFSRGGDGRCPLGPAVREYLISEAMHALGIPTTRSLAVLTTGETVTRRRSEPGAVLIRTAQSHIRVGTFEYAAARQDVEALEALLRYTAKRHYHLSSDSLPDLIEEFLTAFCQRQARTIAQWLGVGFIHGVMNTDNTTLSGETIDYGPCAFMDEFSPDRVYSSIDRNGRYAYGQQPHIAQWNAARLADCLSLLLGRPGYQHHETLKSGIENMSRLIQDEWQTVAAQKMGFSDPRFLDRKLFEEWLPILEATSADFTQAFRRLNEAFDEREKDPAFYNRAPEPMRNFLQKWNTSVTAEAARTSEDAVSQTLRRANPIYIPRNHLVEAALDAAAQSDDWSPVRELLKRIRSPYEFYPPGSSPSPLTHSEATTGIADVYQNPPEPHQKVQATFCGT